MIGTRSVRESTLWPSASRSTRPVRSTGASRTSKPSAASRCAGSRTALCSIAETTMTRRGSPSRSARRAQPRRAKLLASVAPDVNTISDGAAPMSPATACRAAATSAAAHSPARCGEPAFPGHPQARSMASRASGASSVEANVKVDRTIAHGRSCARTRACCRARASSLYYITRLWT